jgi:hypothetical protein
VGQTSFAEGGETIAGEFVASAITHGALADRRMDGEDMGLRLLRRTGGVVCAALDPSNAARVLKSRACAEHWP